MKIAVNTRLLLADRIEGIGRFTSELFRRLTNSHPEAEFHFLFDRKYDPQFIFSENVIPHVIPPQVRHPILASIWFDFTARERLKRIDPDLFISTDGMNSLRPVCKTLTVIHDLNFEQYPEYFPYLLRRYYRKRSPVIASRSTKILTVSKFSASVISELYGIPRQKIEVIYNAPSDEFHPLSESEKSGIKEKTTGGSDYIVFVGGLYYRKNLGNLVRAYEIYKNRSGSELKLVIIGRRVSDSGNLIDLISRSPYRKDVIMMGRIADEEMRNILGAAQALTYVSTVEGFGLPMVEAMKSGVPVIAGKTSSMPEIGGDAAIYADPEVPEDIAMRMQELNEDGALRNRLKQEAVVQAGKFSWDESADKLWRIIEEVTPRQ